MTADPTGFDRLVLAAVGAPTAAPETAGDLAVLMVEAEGLRRENALLRAERDDARRQAAELDARLTRMTHESAAHDRVAPMTAWGIDPGEVE